jgi:hypothetical protein
LITFSDGTTVVGGELPNLGNPGLALNLSRIVVSTSINITVTAVSASSGGIGLAEVEVFLADATKFGKTTAIMPPVKGKRHARSFEEEEEEEVVEEDTLVQKVINAARDLTADGLFRRL